MDTISASDDLGAYFTGMPLEGLFHVYDNIERAVEDVARDGGPIYTISLTETLWAACAARELVREGARLYLKPDPNSPWSNINSTYDTLGAAPCECRT